MTYGLEIRNAAGNLVVDSTKTWKFMDVISKGNASSRTSYNASTDLVLVSLPGGSQNKTYASTLSGTTLSFKEGVSTGSGTSVSLDYVHLRAVNNQTTDSSTYGLEIYGSDGTLVFDSARLKNIGKMEPQRVYQAGTLTGTQIIGIGGQSIGGRKDYVPIDITVPYPSSANGSFFYYEIKNNNKMYFNSFRRTTSGNATRDNPCDIVVYEDILPNILTAQLPPGSDGNTV